MLNLDTWIESLITFWKNSVDYVESGYLDTVENIASSHLIPTLSVHTLRIANFI